MGPARTQTQVEISVSDGIKLGVNAPIRDSGDLANSAGITLVGPLGSITLHEGTIVAARHIQKKDLQGPFLTNRKYNFYADSISATSGFALLR